MLVEAAAQSLCDVEPRKSMLQFFSLELEPSPQLVQREPDTWIPFFSEMEV